MKIGILTQPLANNYGGILQNFALQTVLKDMGNDVITINIPYQKYKESHNIVRSVWRLLKKIKGDSSVLFLDGKKQLNFFNTPGEKQVSFIKKHIKVIDAPLGVDNEFLKENSGWDAIIVGSDQVWRKAFSPHLPSFFLAVVPEGCRKIAYAASFGIDSLDIPEDEIPYYAKLAQKFNAISVRESSGVALCDTYFQVKAELVLDPTMLLTADDYVRLLNIKRTKCSDYAAVYVLDHSPENTAAINRICKAKSLTPMFIGIPSKKGFPAIEEWVEKICNAKYVITDSFHGTVFSVIFNKDFSTLYNNGRGMTRMQSLLSLVALQERLIDACDLSFHENQVSPIDYEKVNKLLSYWKQKSLDYLRNSLKK